MAERTMLTGDEQIALRDMQAEISAARDIISRLEKIGTVDVTEHKERLAQLEQTRNGLLEQFGRPIVQR